MDLSLGDGLGLWFFFTVGQFLLDCWVLGDWWAILDVTVLENDGFHQDGLGVTLIMADSSDPSDSSSKFGVMDSLGVSLWATPVVVAGVVAGVALICWPVVLGLGFVFGCGRWCGRCCVCGRGSLLPKLWLGPGPGL